MAEATELPAHGPEGPSEHLIRDATHRFRDDLLKQSAWRAAQYFADVVHPGAGRLVAVSYVAIKALDAATSLNRGDGFHVMIPAPIPGTDVALSVGIRELSTDPRVRFTVDLMDHSYIEGAPGQKREPARRRGEWPGEWTIPYGLEGIRDHAAVLSGRSKVFPANRGLIEFTDPPKPDNSVVWDVLLERDAYRITLPGHEPVEFPYELNDDPRNAP